MADIAQQHLFLAQHPASVLQRTVVITEMHNHSPMERFFRSLKNEWEPVTGYGSFSDATHEITDYIVGYYSALRPHEYNGG